MAALTWKRWGTWSAHLFDEQDKPTCSTPLPIVVPEKKLTLAELGPDGVPLGKVCAFCLKEFRR
jgi:hypothetical protein